MSRNALMILAGLALLVAGTLVIPALVFATVLSGPAEKVVFAAPGRGELKVEAPGRFYLWHDFETDFDGKVHTHPETLPAGYLFTVRHDGRALKVVSDHGAFVNMGGTASRSVARFDIPAAGRVEIHAKGPADQTRIVSVSRLRILKWLGAAGVSLASLIIVGGAGAALLIIGLVRRGGTAKG